MKFCNYFYSKQNIKEEFFMKKVIMPIQQAQFGKLVLVNDEHGLHGVSGRFLELEDMGASPWGEHVILEREAACQLNRLMKRIDGWEYIVPVSGYRSQAQQQKIWDDSVVDSGIEFTKKYVAVPGHSEHQTGLAIDLGIKMENVDFIRPEFPYSGICQTFRDMAADYGFIERYPEGKEDITHIGHEPWHFRYVGVEHARAITERKLTLEEYVEWLRDLTGKEEGYGTEAEKRRA